MLRPIENTFFTPFTPWSLWGYFLKDYLGFSYYYEFYYGGFCVSLIREGKIMVLKEKVWMALLAGAVLLTVGAKYSPYFPGDVAVAQFVQGITPASTGWAQGISSTAEFPGSLVLVAIAVVVSWRVFGWRAALLALASFAGMWIIGKILGPIIARPRPSPDLVHVARKLSGYSFPSIFALVYASTVGFLGVLFAVRSKGPFRIIVPILCCVLLLLGWAARLSLGAHWPSDVILSYLIGLLWADLLVRFV
jgi:membrane-associated phospholipid phosphatase